MITHKMIVPGCIQVLSVLIRQYGNLLDVLMLMTVVWILLCIMPLRSLC